MLVFLVGSLAVPILLQTAPTPYRFGAVNYPAEARRLGEQGTTVTDLTIDAKGKVVSCAVTASSGSASIDQASCKAALTVARYHPAKDVSGVPTSGTATLKVAWRIGCKSPPGELDPQAIQVCTDAKRRLSRGNLD